MCRTELMTGLISKLLTKISIILNMKFYQSVASFWANGDSSWDPINQLAHISMLYTTPVWCFMSIMLREAICSCYSWMRSILFVWFSKIENIRDHLNWKNPKNFSFWPKFSGPLPLFEKEFYRQKRQYFVPNSNNKVHFFQNFKPPSPILSAPHRFYQLKWPLTVSKLELQLCQLFHTHLRNFCPIFR